MPKIYNRTKNVLKNFDRRKFLLLSLSRTASGRKRINDPYKIKINAGICCIPAFISYLDYQSVLKYNRLLYYDMENYQEAINAYNKSKEYDYQPSDLYYKECIQKIEQKKTNSQKSSGGCYVATCVYGSYDCPEVWTLRRFRDDILSKNFFGRLFIKCYYAVSPTAVKLFGGYMWFHKLFKLSLDKLVAELQDKGVENTSYSDK